MFGLIAEEVKKVDPALVYRNGVKHAREIAEPITDCQAIPYIKIRLRLTRQIGTGVRKKISH
jgi:hypothetical protein